MATRAHIGIELSKGLVHYIFCHNDGYPSWTGDILQTYYNEVQKVVALIKLHSISIVGAKIATTLKECEILRGVKPEDSFTKPHSIIDGDPIWSQLCDFDTMPREDYNYVFTMENKWIVRSFSEDRWQPLADVLAKESEE